VYNAVSYKRKGKKGKFGSRFEVVGKCLGPCIVVPYTSTLSMYMYQVGIKRYKAQNRVDRFEERSDAEELHRHPVNSIKRTNGRALPDRRG
jgi:hypothetical protein